VHSSGVTGATGSPGLTGTGVAGPHRAQPFVPDDRQRTQTELEMEAGRRAVERHKAQLAGPPKNAKGGPASFLLGETIETGIVPAVGAKEAVANRLKPQIPPPAEQAGPAEPVSGQATTATTISRPPNVGPHLRDFMSRVVAWPSENEPGYINLEFQQRSQEQQPDRTFWTAKPFRSVDDFLSFAAWAVTKPGITNIYFCLSQQRDAGQTRSGKPKALRSQAAALVLKALWLDIDVKAPPKGYTSLNDALDALDQFIKKYDLPKLSALVATGGGLHAYWISGRPLSVHEWQPYANGLKAAAMEFGLRCDAGVTADCARVLRVPGTQNWKTKPPRPVRLLGHLGPDYDLAATTFAVLRSKSPAVPKTSGARADHEFFVNPELFPQQSPIVGEESLADGIERVESPPLSVEELRKECGFIREALETGGRDYTQPEWNLTTLCATFLEDGNALAHQMANKHPEYTRDETEELWERKARERKDKNLGWPSCNAIRDAGCRSCATCQHFAKGKSPLHLALPIPLAVDPSRNRQWPNWTDPLDFHEVPSDEAVARINAAGYFVLTLNGDIYKIEPGGGVVVQKREGFTNLFACRQARCGDGTMISAGAAWKCSPERHEYNTIGYWPDDHRRPAKSYNLWQGWGVEPKQGDWSIIYDHILNVVADGDKAKANFILDFCAHMVQRPWEKPGVALVLRGRKGTGKTLLTLILARIVGIQNTLITASGKKLFQQFNWYVADKLLIGAEEAFFAGNHEQNDQLKHLITGDEIEVEQKYGQRISMKSMHRLIMTSNHDQVVAASDDERRFLLCDVSDKRRGDDVYFAPLVRIAKGEDEPTLASFMYELQTRDIKDWKAEAAARKVASIDLAWQKLLSLEPPLQWMLENAQYDGTAATGAANEAERNSMLNEYREWAKRVQVRGATDFTGAEKFWASIKRLLNDEIFPGRKLFRSSGGKRYVVLPAKQDILHGFNRLLGGKVVEVDEDP
jgi:hypothetical protein